MHASEQSQSPSNLMSTSEALVDALRRLGVSQAFGVMGGAMFLNSINMIALGNQHNGKKIEWQH